MTQHTGPARTRNADWAAIAMVAVLGPRLVNVVLAILQVI